MKRYNAIILDVDYLQSLSDNDLSAITDYVESHDVSAGLVTAERKADYEKWLKKTSLRIDIVVGNIKKRRRWIRKPEPLPILVAMARMNAVREDTISICTKSIDLEASRAAGIAVVENPSVEALLPMLTDSTRKTITSADTDIPAPRKGIFGAICGDIIGISYEQKKYRTKNYDLELFTERSTPSDDTILTLAIAKWLMGEHSDDQLAHYLSSFGLRYANLPVWGSGFFSWFSNPNLEYGREAGSNGCAMRVSPVGFYASSLNEALQLAAQQAAMTHNTPEGIHGTQSVAACVFLARQGKTKQEIKAYIEQQFGYDLDRSIQDVRDSNDIRQMSLECEKCAADAIICWLLSDTYEVCIRNAVSLGGDADTLAAIAGGIAGATPGMEIPEDIATKCYNLLPDELKQVLAEWERR